MAFKLFETSLFSGSPVELYTFKYHGEEWHYTSHNSDYTFEGKTYKSIPLVRGSIRRTKDTVAENYLTVEIEPTGPVPDKFRIIAPAKPMLITIQRVHRKDPDAEAITLFNGRVRGVDWSKPLAVMSCDSMGSVLKRAGLRMNYQTMCNHMHYSPACGVPRGSYRVDAHIAKFNEDKLTSSVFAGFKDGWFKLGYMEYRGYNYMIIDHTGDTLTLLTIPEGMLVDEQVTVYAGCNRSLDTCWDKFNNGLNFGGCPYIPNANPFRWGI